MNIDPKLAMGLSYVGGWVTGLIFFLLEKQNRQVRFHAMQSILFFGGLTVLNIVISIASTAGVPFLGLLGFRSRDCRLRRLDCPVDQWFPGQVLQAACRGRLCRKICQPGYDWAERTSYVRQSANRSHTRTPLPQDTREGYPYHGRRRLLVDHVGPWYGYPSRVSWGGG